MSEFIKKRLRNKGFIVGAISVGVAAYKLLTGHEVGANFQTFADLAITALISMGVIIDPSTPGLSDSTASENEGA